MKNSFHYDEQQRGNCVTQMPTLNFQWEINGRLEIGVRKHQTAPKIKKKEKENKRNRLGVAGCGRLSYH